MGVGDNIEVCAVIGNQNAGTTAGGLLQQRLTAAVGSVPVKEAVDLLDGDIGDGYHAGQGIGCDIGHIHAVADAGISGTGQIGEDGVLGAARRGDGRCAGILLGQKLIDAIKGTRRHGPKQYRAEGQGGQPPQYPTLFPLGTAGLLRRSVVHSLREFVPTGVLHLIIHMASSFPKWVRCFLFLP